MSGEGVEVTTCVSDIHKAVDYALRTIGKNLATS